eukprot:COSAG06_NODE_29449_length_556_cov_0.792123_1_plen_94_part_10
MVCICGQPRGTQADTGGCAWASCSAPLGAASAPCRRCALVTPVAAAAAAAAAIPRHDVDSTFFTAARAAVWGHSTRSPPHSATKVESSSPALAQ